MKLDTAWVKPPQQVGGLDHLAVQATCINIYSQMLPGITNVTDRARYYSFYPWLIWAFDQAGYTRYDAVFIERFRRADCLFTLIAERHAITAGGEHADHAAATVGSNTLATVASSLDSEESVALSDFSLREGAKQRYFMSTLGGLGQYYLGVLRELSILDGDAASGIKYTRQIGQRIAHCVDAGVPRDLFLSVVEQNKVSTTELLALSAFCPCQISTNPAEQTVLTELFSVQGDFADRAAIPRRHSLQTILQLTNLLERKGGQISEDVFRGCVYSNCLPDGSSWEIPERLLTNRTRWAVYARNEILSIAVQGLFFAVLDSYEESGLRFGSSTQLVEWFLTQPETTSAISDIGEGRTFSRQAAKSADWLPALTQWGEVGHEVYLMEEVARLSRSPKSSEVRQKILIYALQILLALSSREINHAEPYADLMFDERYFGYYPVNLRSFVYYRDNVWSELTTKEVLRWLLNQWGIDLHLRVALRKLRGQSKSTFRIRPSDRGMEVIGVPPAVHTRPRFNQSLRILKDIGALERFAPDQWQASTLGLSILELVDA